MKTSLFIQNFCNSLQIGFAVMVTVFLSACASSSWMKQTDSALPIEAIHSGSGSIQSFRAHETSHRLYVVGSARPYPLTRPEHVDIQLLGADGRVLAEKTDDLDSPMRPHPVRSGNQSYVASFPLSEARQAAKIRVIYHGGVHSKGNS